MSDQERWYDEKQLLPNSFYLNVGIPLGSTGWGIRDNSGTIESKNFGGSWNPITLFKRASSTVSPLTSGDTFSATTVMVQGANGESTIQAISSQLVSTTVSTTVDTTIQLPANAFILGVAAKVTATLSATATNLTVIAKTSGTTFSSTIGVDPAAAVLGVDSCPYWNSAAQVLEFTADSTMSTSGRIRVSIHYLKLIGPTS